jgi:integrase
MSHPRRQADLLLPGLPGRGEIAPQGTQFKGERKTGRAAIQGEGKMKEAKKVKGVFEKVVGSGVWWVRYADASGRIRREKVGNKGAALKLYQKRKVEILQGKKLPETLRNRVILFAEIADDAMKYSKANNRGHKFDEYRIGRLKAEFGGLPAEIPIENLRRWFDDQKWKPATSNRYKSTLSLAYRLAMENGNASTNPARLLKRKPEDNGRVRFLNQFKPAMTDLDYLKDHKDEESRLRATIQAHYPTHMPEFEIALHTGVRPSEQYGLTWGNVDLARKLITIPKSKNGDTRHVPLNSIALAAFRELFARSTGEGRVFVNIHGEPLHGYKHWFRPAVEEAGISGFTWYCLRHTFASRLVMAGVDLRTVAELMGHKTIQMTMRYAHLAPAHKLAAVERLAGSWSLEEATDTRTSTGREEQSGELIRQVN